MVRWEADIGKSLEAWGMASLLCAMDRRLCLSEKRRPGLRPEVAPKPQLAHHSIPVPQVHTCARMQTHTHVHTKMEKYGNSNKEKQN